jgi:hypothetical protein
MRLFVLFVDMLYSGRLLLYHLIRRQCQPFAIFEGYNGLVEGGDKIKELGWEDVRGLLSMVLINNYFRLLSLFIILLHNSLTLSRVAL